MGKKKLGSTKRTDEILLAPVDLATEVTGHLKPGTGMPPGRDGEPGRDSYVPGPRGLIGPRGLQGIPGLDASAPREPLIIPGPRGFTGPQGLAGMPGPPGLDGITREPLVIVGPRGPAGPAGANGSSTAGPSGPPGLDGQPAREPPFVPYRPPDLIYPFGANGNQFGFSGAGANIYVQLGRVAGGVAANVNLPINTLRAVPFTVARTAKLIWMMTRVAVIASAGGVARMGIYSSSHAKGFGPNALIVDTGQFITTAVATLSMPISITLYAGRIYWYAILAGVAAASFGGLDPSDAWYGVIGSTLGNMAGNPDNYLTIAQAYGALPATFPSPGTARGIVPAVFVGYAS